MKRTVRYYEVTLLIEQETPPDRDPHIWDWKKMVPQCQQVISIHRLPSMAKIKKPPVLVPKGDGCRCGNRNQDSLMWQADGKTVRCDLCKRVYQPGGKWKGVKKEVLSSAMMSGDDFTRLSRSIKNFRK